MIQISNKDADTLARFVEQFHTPATGESLALVNLKRRAWLIINKLRTTKNNTTK